MPVEILISCNPDQSFAHGHRVVTDEQPDSGPLGALVSCLHATKIARLLVLAVDLPEMPMNFLGELVYADCGVVPVHGSGMPEPLAAVYPVEILPIAEQQLSAGKLAMRELVNLGIRDGLLQPRAIADNELGFFSNLNEAPRAESDA